MAEPAPADQLVDDVRKGYAFEGPCLELGALVSGDVALPDAPVRIPLSVLHRHGLVAGATGTGKTKTLQLMAEQLSAHGVPVFAPDVKGDLSGLAAPGEPGDSGRHRHRARDRAGRLRHPEPAAASTLTRHSRDLPQMITAAA